MKYCTGTPGRIVIARFEHNDDILAGLRTIAIQENIRAAVVHFMGGVQQGSLVVGPQDDAIMPPQPTWHSITESHECVGMATIFWHEDQPVVHLHGAFGKGERVTVGCLRNASSVYLVLEAVILEVLGTAACRRMDTTSGLCLLQVQGDA